MYFNFLSKFPQKPPQVQERPRPALLDQRHLPPRRQRHSLRNAQQRPRDPLAHRHPDVHVPGHVDPRSPRSVLRAALAAANSFLRSRATQRERRGDHEPDFRLFCDRTRRHRAASHEHLQQRRQGK